MCLESYNESIKEALLGAEKVQDFLFADKNITNCDFEKSIEVLISAFEKRVDKIKQVDRNNPSWKIEMKNRLLQQASLSIKALQVLGGYEGKKPENINQFDLYLEYSTHYNIEDDMVIKVYNQNTDLLYTFVYKVNKYNIIHVPPLDWLKIELQHVTGINRYKIHLKEIPF